MTPRLAGKVALITGTGGGQGRTAALRFTAENADPQVHARLDEIMAAAGELDGHFSCGDCASTEAAGGPARGAARR